MRLNPVPPINQGSTQKPDIIGNYTENRRTYIQNMLSIDTPVQQKLPGHLEVVINFDHNNKIGVLTENAKWALRTFINTNPSYEEELAEAINLVRNGSIDMMYILEEIIRTTLKKKDNIKVFVEEPEMGD